MKITLDIPAARIADLMVTAIESGGSNYWCGGVELEVNEATALVSPWYSDPTLYEGAFLIVVLECDEETGKDKIHRCNQAAFAKGFVLMAEKHGSHFGDFMAENEDTITADVFLQCIALGDVVYG